MTATKEGAVVEENIEKPTETQIEEPTEDFSESSGKESQDEPTEESEPEYAKEIVIDAGHDMYFGHKQWHIIHGSTHVWEPLIYLDESLNPQPCLVESWDANEEMTEWRFQLKDNIIFHDGTPLDAKVAVENLRELHENYRSLDNLDRMEVVDSQTFTIYLRESTPNLPTLLIYEGSAMLSPGTRDQENMDVPVPYGTGPFKFKSIEYKEGKRGEHIVLERNPDYWGDSPKVERIIYRHIFNPSARIQALKTGEIDAIAGMDALHFSASKSLISDENIRLLTIDVPTTHYLFFNNDKPPFDNQALRQAVSMAIDREMIVDEVLKGIGVPGTSLITQLAEKWVNPKASPTYNPEEAQAIAASVLGGERVQATFLVRDLLGQFNGYNEIAQIVQVELAKLGIDVEIKNVEREMWFEMLANDEYHISMYGTTMSTGDPHNFLSSWAQSEGLFNQMFSISYESEKIQTLMDQAASELDQNTRKEIYDEIQTVLIEETPFTPIYHEVGIYATQDNVFDLTLDALYRPSLDTVYKIEE